MKSNIKLTSAGKYSALATDESSNLKALVRQACGGSVRRIDRVTQLALLGACDCVGDSKLPLKTGLYLSSLFGSFNNSRETLEEIYQQQRVPSPFQFVNTVGNTACFYLANQFNIQASSMFISQSCHALQSAMLLALIDLQAGRIDAALIGLINEAGQPLATYKIKLNLNADRDLIEGAWFFLLTRDNSATSLLSDDFQLEQFSEFAALIDFLKNAIPNSNKETHLAISGSVPEEKLLQLVNSKNFSLVSKANDSKVFFQYPEADALYNHLKFAVAGKTLCYIDFDNSNRWNAMIVKKS